MMMRTAHCQIKTKLYLEKFNTSSVYTYDVLNTSNTVDI